MKCNRPLHVACLCLMTGMVPLIAQGYETKFKAVGFKPGDSYHTDEDVQVSLNGGGLEVSIPLGPALPGPIPIRPMAHYHGKYVQSLNSINWPFDPAEIETSQCLENGDTTNFKRWLPPKNAFGEIHPGYLLFRVGSLQLPGESTIVVTSSSGKSAGYYLGMPGTYSYRSDIPSDVAEINAMVTALAPEWVPIGATTQSCTLPSTTPLAVAVHRSQPLGTTIGARLDGGTTLVFGPSNAQIFSNYPMTFNGVSSTVVDAGVFSIPNEILQVDGDLIILWRRNRNVYHKQVGKVLVSVMYGVSYYGDQESAWWDKSVYHPVWIKTRDGFKVNVEIYRGGPTTSPYPGLSDGGLFKGFKVSSNSGATWFQVGGPDGTTPEYPVTFGGMGLPGTAGITFFNSLDGQHQGGPDDTWQPGTTNGYNNCPNFLDEGTLNCAALGFSADHITYGDQTTSFQWGGPQGLLSGLTTPNGKTFAFTHEIFAGPGVNAFLAATGIPVWDYSRDTPNSKNFWSAVTRMDVSDGAQTRSTSYQWRIPQVDTASTYDYLSAIWASRTQGVAMTLPDGQTILHVFAPAVDLPQSAVNAQYHLPISAAIMDQSARTLMAQRQTIVARYYYAKGETGWNGFISSGTDPESSNWYKRELMEGFDLRNWETSLTKVTSNTEPRPTRTIREEKGGPVEVIELDGWDATRNQYAISRTYHLPPGTSAAGQPWAPGLFGGSGSYPSVSAAVDLAATTTTFAPIEVGLFARPSAKTSQQTAAPVSGTVGTIGDSSFEYYSGSQAHLLSGATQKATDGSSMQLKTDFYYAAWGDYTRMSKVGLSGTWGTSGSTGYSYDYDNTGRWLTSIQVKNANYKEQEPKHDWGGNPTSRIDANGIETTYSWDEYGRLTGILPPSPETPTSVAYDSDFKGATVTRGTASTHYRYNIFGELISIEKPTGDLKTFAYDLGGRKTFESVWSSTTVGTNLSYDSQGRLSQTVSPNGEATDYSYSSPLVKTVTQHPLVHGSSTDTTTTLEQDSLGRLAKVTNANGEVTNYTYDPAGKLTKVVQGVQVRNWNFNGLGWLTGLVQPESGTTTYSDFTIFGKPEITSYAGRVVSTTYDLLGRATDIAAVDGSVNQHFEFDGGVPFNGKLRCSSEPGVRLDYGYLGLNGRLDSFTTTLGTVMGATVQPMKQTFDYDNLGNLTSATLPSGRAVVYGFDPKRDVPQDVLAQTNVPGASGPVFSIAAVTQFNAADLPLQVSFLTNRASTTITYGADQTRMATLTHSKTGANAFTRVWTYSWDTAGQLVSDGEDSYEYDNLARLVKANLKPLGGASAFAQDFTYDTYGNQLSRSTSNAPIGLDRNFANFAFNATDLAAHNQLPFQTAGSGTTGAAYNAQGNLIQIFKQVGASGRAISLTYDALGRVSQMTDAESGTTEKYGYSPEGLRTRIETWQGTVLQKVEIRIYNPQRQLVSTFETW